MTDISGSKRIAINLLATFVYGIVLSGTEFFLSPYIVKVLGIEAQGFVSLAANFASYVALVTIALNSVSGRFIAIEVRRGHHKNAAVYYTSVLWGNLILFGLLLTPIGLCIFYLDKMINIPANLVLDVKILFAFVFINLFITNVFSLWNTTFYIINKTYLQLWCSVVVGLINAVSIILLFLSFRPRIWYSATAGIFTSILTVGWGLWNKNRYLPNLKAQTRLFSLKNLLIIISSGIWRTLQSLGEMLLNGLDLLICNLMIDTKTMGVLALSKTLPTLIRGLTLQIVFTFAPQLTALYAAENQEGMKREVKRTCKITAIIGTIPVAVLMVLGKEFFTIWVPSQDAQILQKLSLLSCFGVSLTAGIQPVGNIFLTANRLKPQAFSVIVSGILNTAIVFLCLKTTNWGVYAIAGASTIIGLIRNIIYTVPAGARYLGFKWRTFMAGFVYSFIGSIAASLICLIFKYLFIPNSWLTLIITIMLSAGIGLIFNAWLIFNKKERNLVIRIIRTRVIKG